MSHISRRAFLGGGGAVIVSFGLMQIARAETDSSPANPPQAPATAVPTEVAEQQPVPSPVPAPSNPPAGAIDPNQVDSWLAVGQDGKVTIFSGRVELGTGTRTALAQIAADELSLPFESITMVQGDTARAPDEGYTAGSKTVQVGGVNVRQAAAEARQALLRMAGTQFGVSPDDLTINNGTISVTGNPSQTVAYGDLIGGKVVNRAISTQTPLKDPSQYTIVGQSVPRLDLPGKIFGQPSYLQDLRLPGMLHGRTIHPAGIGATIASVDQSSAWWAISASMRCSSLAISASARTLTA